MPCVILKAIVGPKAKYLYLNKNFFSAMAPENLFLPTSGSELPQKFYSAVREKNSEAHQQVDLF